MGCRRIDDCCDCLDGSSSGFPKSNSVGPSDTPPRRSRGTISLHRPAINRFNEYSGARQSVALGKGVDPGQSRNGEIDVRDPKIIGHINSSEKECII
jgi:hypothetical protein